MKSDNKQHDYFPDFSRQIVTVLSISFIHIWLAPCYRKNEDSKTQQYLTQQSYNKNFLRQICLSNCASMPVDFLLICCTRQLISYVQRIAYFQRALTLKRQTALLHIFPHSLMFKHQLKISVYFLHNQLFTTIPIFDVIDRGIQNN